MVVVVAGRGDGRCIDGRGGVVVEVVVVVVMLMQALCYILRLQLIPINCRLQTYSFSIFNNVTSWSNSQDGVR